MESQAFASVFDALADTPAEAASLRARSELLAAIQSHVRAWELPQEATAQRLGVTRPQLDELMRGKLGRFSLDELLTLTAAAGLVLEVRATQAA